MARPAEPDDINFVELERELRSAIEQDQRRALQNDAKLRAVQQRVGSYDEFRSVRERCRHAAELSEFRVEVSGRNKVM